MNTKANDLNKLNPTQGPFLRMAIFCSEIIEGKDNALSAIRIIDRVNFQTPSLEEFHTKGITHLFKILLSFTSGNASGEHNLCLKPIKPNPGKKGVELKEFNKNIDLPDKPEGVSNIALVASFTLDQEGVWAFDVLLNGQQMTRMFLTVSVLEKKKV